MLFGTLVALTACNEKPVNHNMVRGTVTQTVTATATGTRSQTATETSTTANVSEGKAILFLEGSEDRVVGETLAVLSNI